MTNKQARLISAVADAMLNQGVSQSGLARTSGVAQSMISAALLGKYDLKEEKWRLICEKLSLDYDEITADPPESSEEMGGVPANLPQPSAEKLLPVPQDDAPVCCEPDVGSLSTVTLGKAECRVAARYLAARLKEDIGRGIDMSLDELYALLEVTRIMGAC